jgi:hypothetical protein
MEGFFRLYVKLHSEVLFATESPVTTPHCPGFLYQAFELNTSFKTQIPGRHRFISGDGPLGLGPTLFSACSLLAFACSPCAVAR